MADRKVYITLKGRFSAKIADGTKPADLGIVVQDNSGETVVETLDQENHNIKMGKGCISGDSTLKLAITMDEELEVAKAIKGLSFFLEDSNPQSKRVQHGFSLLDDFDFKVMDWTVTDSK